MAQARPCREIGDPGYKAPSPAEASASGSSYKPSTIGYPQSIIRISNPTDAAAA